MTDDDQAMTKEEFYLHLADMLSDDEAADLMREMGRERLEELVERSTQSAHQREFWRMMHGPLHSSRVDAEERNVDAAKKILADPGVFEHIARLKAQRDHARAAAEALARWFDMEGGYARESLEDHVGVAPGDGWLPVGDR